MKSLSIILVLGFLSLVPTYANEKFDSAHSILIEGIIPEGTIITNSPSQWMVKPQIEEQLLYTIGQLNGLEGGTPDTSRTEIEIKEIITQERGRYLVKYSAKLIIAWPREQKIPESFAFILPANTSPNAISHFFKTYGADEHGSKRCIAWEAHNVTSGILWYYYRPQKSSCPLKSKENQDVIHTLAYFNVSNENTQNKYPEYAKVWEDGKLVITAIFGKAVEGAESEYDAGVSAYTSTVNELLRKFGKPTSSSVALNSQNTFSRGIQNPEIYLTFETPKGTVDAALFLIEGIRVARSDFAAKYNQRTINSDFISYSGHSGLGANIRALAGMGNFAPDQYQIFLVNGCDTFAYVDDSLQRAHFELNPDSTPDKYLDIITNAMPSYFHMNSRSNMAIINSLYESKATYKQILSLFDRNQRAVVTGEQDNTDPSVE